MLPHEICLISSFFYRRTLCMGKGTKNDLSKELTYLSVFFLKHAKPSSFAFCGLFSIRRDISPSRTNSHPSVICTVIQQTIKVESIKFLSFLMFCCLNKNHIYILLSARRNIGHLERNKFVLAKHKTAPITGSALTEGTFRNKKTTR